MREGIIKHRPDSDANAPAEYAPGEAPTLEAQLVDYVDEIAYNNHDVDDGLSSGMFGVEAIREVALFREAHDAARARRIDDERIERHAVVRYIIDRCVGELIALDAGEPRGGASDLGRGRTGRRPPAGRLLGRDGGPGARAEAVPAAEHVPPLPRGADGDKAGRILRDLFQSYVGEPGQLPPHFQEPLARDGVHRTVCDYIAGMTDRFAVDEHQKLFDPTVRV